MVITVIVLVAAVWWVWLGFAALATPPPARATLPPMKAAAAQP